VTTLLSDPDWAKWSDLEIARKAGVSRELVGDLRHELSVISDRYVPPTATELWQAEQERQQMRKVERAGTTYEMDVTGIGERAQQTSSARAAHRGIWRPCSGCPTSSLCMSRTGPRLDAQLPQARRAWDRRVIHLNHYCRCRRLRQLMPLIHLNRRGRG